MEGRIYCYHSPNNKYYVGKTYCSDKKRQKDHKYCALTKNGEYPFAKAIRKYGWNEILKTYQILEIINANTKEELNYLLIDRENYWIDTMNTLVPNGYNVQHSNHVELPHNPNKEETYKKISQKLKGKNNNPLLSNRVKCIETNIIYPSVREAERQNNFPKNSLWGCLHGKSHTAKGYHWKYVDKETPKFDIEKARKKPLKGYNPQCISVICVETGKKYNSINECVRDMFENKWQKRGVSKSCKTGSAYHNYHFKFLNQGNPVPSLNKN
jgi:hypothetical protein